MAIPYYCWVYFSKLAIIRNSCWTFFPCLHVILPYVTIICLVVVCEFLRFSAQYRNAFSLEMRHSIIYNSDIFILLMLVT